VAAGTSSVGQYAVMQRGDLLAVYCPRSEMMMEQLSGSQTDRFPNIEIMGMIRLRESPYYRPELRLDDFMSAMQELFP
jgi:hypothetical protein